MDVVLGPVLWLRTGWSLDMKVINQSIVFSVTSIPVPGCKGSVVVFGITLPLAVIWALPLIGSALDTQRSARGMGTWCLHLCVFGTDQQTMGPVSLLVGQS